MASEPPIARLARERCAIYPFDVSKASFGALPERYVPRDWPANKFAAELWIARALETHPWRAESAERADLVLFESNMSLACRVGKMFTGRNMWKALATTVGVGAPIGKSGRRANASVHWLLANATNATARAFVLTDNECPSPWTGFGKAGDFLKIKDHGPGKYDVIAPFVLSRPPWLVGRPRAKQAIPRVVRWDDRRLLFFAGHVPKLYIQPSRYQIWRQIRRWPNVTAISATINCTIGSMSICREIRNCSDAKLRSYCVPFCQSHVMDDLRVNINDQPWLHRHVKLPEQPKIFRCGRGRLQMIKQCRSYRRVEWEQELPDMAASTRNLPAHRYVDHAMGHKFCLAAPGDFVSTPKITEYVAMGAAGGCLPLMVVAGDAWRTLPYVRWVDWCRIAFIVDARVANTDMPRVLRKLEAVTAQQAADMHR